MPLVQVDLPRALFDAKAKEIGLELQDAFVETVGVPSDDRFQIFRPHDAGEIVFDPAYGGVDRQDVMYIQILMVHLYSAVQKRELFRAITTRMMKLGIRRQDVFIAAYENSHEDWYAGFPFDE